MKMKKNWKRTIGTVVAAVSAFTAGSTVSAQYGPPPSAQIYDDANLPSVKTGQNYSPNEGTAFGNEISLTPDYGPSTLASFSLEYNTSGSVGNAQINFMPTPGRCLTALRIQRNRVPFWAR
jgi:hypothetical protein